MTQDDVIKWYENQDPRSKAPRAQDAIRANNVGIFDFDRVLTTGKGAHEIHELRIGENIVPMRLLSWNEELLIKHQTHVEMKDNPFYQHFREDYSEFNKLYYIKCISLATSPNVHNITNADRFLKEADLKNHSPIEIASLISAYQHLQKMYNFDLNDISEETVNTLIAGLLDPEKKYPYMAGMTFSQHQNILPILLEIITKLEDNTSIVTSLENTSEPKVQKKKPKDL